MGYNAFEDQKLMAAIYPGAQSAVKKQKETNIIQFNREFGITDDSLAAEILKAETIYTKIKEQNALSLTEFTKSEIGLKSTEFLSKYNGKVVYIDFLVPWCSPCMGEMYSSRE